MFVILYSSAPAVSLFHPHLPPDWQRSLRQQSHLRGVDTERAIACLYSTFVSNRLTHPGVYLVNPI